MSDRIRVLVADDHAATRRDICAAVAADERFTVCAEAEDAMTAISAAVEHLPDICLIDVRMPGSGIAATWEITARLPETKVVILTVSRYDEDLLAALRAGAAGYLWKDIDPARLPHALADVFAGEAALPRSLVARLLEEFRDRAPRRRALVGSDNVERLTSREWQVLELLRMDLSTAQIASRLVLSQATVRSHIASILRKLRATDRAAVKRMLADGWETSLGEKGR